MFYYAKESEAKAKNGLISPPEVKMKTKQEKQSIINELKENVKNAKGIIFLNLSKLNVSNLFKLKKELKKNEGVVKVAKKTFVKIANPESKQVDIKGPFALIFDYSSNLKPFSILGKLKKDLKLEIFGGLLNNKVLSEKETWAITELPSEDALKNQLVYVLKSRFSGIAYTLKSPLNKLAIALNQINTKKSAA